MKWWDWRKAFTVVMLAAIVAAVVDAATSANREIASIEQEVQKSKVVQDLLLKERNKAHLRCTDQGRIPLMGFGYDLVCLEKASVAWVYSNPEPAQ